VQRLGLRQLPLIKEDLRQVVIADGGFGVALTECLELDRQGATVQRLGLRQPPLGVEDGRQVGVAAGGEGVALP
jgi:hypothetical protein